MKVMLVVLLMLTGCVTAPCPDELGGDQESCSLIYIPVPTGDLVLDAAQAIDLFYRYRQSIHENEIMNHNYQTTTQGGTL